MTVWVLHCWALDLPNGEVVSQHPTLDAAIEAVLAWIEADRHLLSQQRGVYSVAESGEWVWR